MRYQAHPSWFWHSVHGSSVAGLLRLGPPLIPGPSCSGQGVAVVGQCVCLSLIRSSVTGLRARSCVAATAAVCVLSGGQLASSAGPAHCSPRGSCVRGVPDLPPECVRSGACHVRSGFLRGSVPCGTTAAGTPPASLCGFPELQPAAARCQPEQDFRFRAWPWRNYWVACRLQLWL